MSVLVSGCFDILHRDHLTFLERASAHGPLTAALAADDTIVAYKGRKPFLPIEHRLAVMRALRCVDAAVASPAASGDVTFDFLPLLASMPHIRKLAVSAGDPARDRKLALCSEYGLQLVVVDLAGDAHSSHFRGRMSTPVRVDLAGGWLDCQDYPFGCVVNCTVTPGIEHGWSSPSGLGQSAAVDVARGVDAVQSEADRGAGWQDAAVIMTGGLCIWSPGTKPVLRKKSDHRLLAGRMALLYVGDRPCTDVIRSRSRNLQDIATASLVVADAVDTGSWESLCLGVRMTLLAQRDEGMAEPPFVPHAEACKYCGAGWGGHVLYLFKDVDARKMAADATPGLTEIEPCA